MTEVPELALARFLLARIAEDEAAYRNAGQLLFTEDRCLAECEAKRLIVEDVRDGYLIFGDGAISSTDGLALRVLAALGLPYADHPDYREEWRPRGEH